MNLFQKSQTLVRPEACFIESARKQADWNTEYSARDAGMLELPAVNRTQRIFRSVPGLAAAGALKSGIAHLFRAERILLTIQNSNVLFFLAGGDESCMAWRN
jgi:hypothetical protein